MKSSGHLSASAFNHIFSSLWTQNYTHFHFKEKEMEVLRKDARRRGLERRTKLITLIATIIMHCMWLQFVVEVENYVPEGSTCFEGESWKCAMCADYGNEMKVCRKWISYDCSFRVATHAASRPIIGIIKVFVFYTFK